MRIAITGGGTGGHVYPALEIARLASEEGADVRYFGSLRGMEGPACREWGISFAGFGSEPIPRLVSLRGIRSALLLARSANKARQQLREWNPNVVFSTGGYAASPILAAAKSLRLRTVLHEQNSIPGRTTMFAAKSAWAVCTVFQQTESRLGRSAIKTGMPLRRELIEASQAQAGNRTTTLVYGGSQGSRAINTIASAVGTVLATEDFPWHLVAGKNLFSEVDPPSNPYFRVSELLSSNEISDVYMRTLIAVTRAGAGTISELALFGIPAVLIPLPTSFADHQLHNANEIASTGGAAILTQDKLSHDSLIAAWKDWVDQPERITTATSLLRSWAVPDASRRVVSVVKEAANASAN